MNPIGECLKLSLSHATNCHSSCEWSLPFVAWSALIWTNWGSKAWSAHFYFITDYGLFFWSGFTTNLPYESFSNTSSHLKHVSLVPLRLKILTFPIPQQRLNWHSAGVSKEGASKALWSWCNFTKTTDNSGIIVKFLERSKLKFCERDPACTKCAEHGPPSLRRRDNPLAVTRYFFS